MLLGCDRRDVLQGMGEEYYVDVEGMWPALRGTMIHSTMDRREYPGADPMIREVRFSTQVQTAYGPVTFTGKPDAIVVQIVEGVAYCKIIDYKSTNEIGHKTVAADEHIMQINMYAWLVGRCLLAYLGDLRRAVESVLVEELEIVYGDMRKTRRFTSSGTLEARGKMLTERDAHGKIHRVKPPQYERLVLAPIPLLSSAQVEAWVVGRIEDRIRAKDILPPVLPPEREWMCLNCPVREACQRIANQKLPQK
jgi:hypothetical protein